MNKIAISVSLLFFSIILFSPEALAHVKWFIPTDGDVPADFVRYHITDTAVLVWIGIALLLVSSSIFLDSRLPSLPMVDTRARQSIISILRICTAISLLLTAYNGSLIAPHYQADDAFGKVLIVIEASAGLLLLFKRLAFYAASFLLLLFSGVIIKFGVIETIEYWNIVGISLFLLFINIPIKNYQDMLKPYSVSALRIFTGIALITLGFSEKLLSAEYGEAFLREYHWNFLLNLGFEHFSDRLFVLSAGVMEVVLGTILVLGTTTRLNVLVISGFMLTSNITFFLEGNVDEAIMEIIGHLPIIAIAVICVFFGSGQKFKITSLFNRQS